MNRGSTDLKTTPARRVPCGLSIRQRSDSDTPALFQLFSEPNFIENVCTLEPFQNKEEMLDWMRSLSNTRFEIVGVLDGLPIAFGGLYLCEARLNHMGLLMLGVREAYEGMGIGSMLLSALVTTADVIAGLSRLQLTVLVNNERALHLYSKFGFEIEGRHKKFLRGQSGFVDIYTMARLVEDSGSPTEEDISEKIQSALAMVNRPPYSS